MIRNLSDQDASVICEVVNRAASAYQGIIPDDCYHEPYMPLEELRREMNGISFIGWYEGKRLTGVMGLQKVGDVTLIRHAYILPECQRKGVGTKLLDHLKRMTRTRELLVGTWADATWAVEFYAKNGFESRANKDALLARYWKVPPRQIETSVVLGFRVP